MKEVLKEYFFNFIGFVKHLIAYVFLCIFGKRILAMNIWIIKEKANEARDNGFCFYKYLREKHPDINAYYVITKDSPDREKVAQYGNVVLYGTMKHYIYYAAAKYSIGSQLYGALPPNILWIYQRRILHRKDQKVIFLQHGIIKDDIPWLYYEMTQLDLFVCAAAREYDFVKKMYHYPDKNVQLLGLCRYDNLYGQKPEKIVLIMPTFRYNLKPKNYLGEATDSEKEIFLSSEYYLQYSKLLSNERLLKQLEDTGYRLVFYPHYSFQAYISLFQKFDNKIVTIADRYHYDVQQLLKNSALLVTDFSSVYFDFAYMQKPMVFFQFDEKEYRKSHYQQGYFDYRLDGFGPVYADAEEVIDFIVHMIYNNCFVEEQYLQQEMDFFPMHDQNNCERTYKAIQNL